MRELVTSYEVKYAFGVAVSTAFHSIVYILTPLLFPLTRPRVKTNNMFYLRLRPQLYIK